MDEYKYAIEWFAYGFNNHDEDVVKFMMYWIAFNWLYSEYNAKWSNNKCFVLKEHEKIIEFCGANMDILSDYDAFESGDVDVFLERPIKDGITGKEHRKAFEGLRYGNESVKITNLLLTIYYVRCNLFHGSKSIYNLRDRGLVSSASRILEGYLRVLLPKELLEEGLRKKSNS